MSKFILIENPGVASPEAFTLLGASNKAGTEAIGQFGSGTKFGVLTLLRKGIYPIVYCGNLCLEFGHEEVTFDGATHQQVFVKISGKDRNSKQVNRTEKLSLVLRYGEIDWKDNVELALREFVSNALDAVQGDASQITVAHCVKAPRAKAGYTRVYVPTDEAGEAFVKNIDKWFLQFSIDGVWRNSSIIVKDAPSPARIYRRGVFVREITHRVSVFDYNLNDLPLDEARVANDYTVKEYAQKALLRVGTAKLVGKLLLAGKDAWESSFDLTGQYDWALPIDAKEAAAKVWKEAEEKLVDEKTIFASETQNTTLAEGKGYKVVRLTESQYQNVLKHGLRTVNSILTTDEREGRRVDKVVNSAAGFAVLHVWNVLQTIDATRGETFPVVKSYTEEISSERRTLGLYKDGTVYINNCLLSGCTVESISSELFAVCLEELAHHITKATDNSRDFQEYFIQTLTKVLR